MAPLPILTRWPLSLPGTLMTIEQVPDIPMFRQNTAAFVHDLPDGALSNVDGESDYVRVQVLTNAGALDRDKQLAVVEQFTDLVTNAAGDPGLREASLGAPHRSSRRWMGALGPRSHQRRAGRRGPRQIAELSAKKS